MQKQNFTEVAKLHGVAPSSVSRSIAALENELGIRLLQRSTRKLETTESVLIYY
jgi:DNA-binding transcriptional LysR family regulator